MSPIAWKIIPQQEYPLRIFAGEPLPFSLETQRRSMEWVHSNGYFVTDPEWLQEISTDAIKDVLSPILQRLGHSSNEVMTITFLADGGFNKVFTIEISSTAYVLRIALPVDPYFKTESDVATTEFIRHFTTIPVARIHAFDSSMENALGLEWILMEKITSGKRLDEAWDDFSLEQKTPLTEVIAEWVSQLLNVTSENIGSIYVRDKENGNLEFFVGRSVNRLLSQENRLLYDVPRGLFSTLQDYYAAVLEVARLDVEAVAQRFHADPYAFDDTSPRLKWTFLDQDTPFDKPENLLKKEREEELEFLSKGIDALQKALPELCDSCTDAQLSTRLMHMDLSRRNILVGDNGVPVALLDWENIQFQPLIFLTERPDFLECRNEQDPENIGPPGVELGKHVDKYTDPEEREEYLQNEREWYDEQMNDYQCAVLHGVYCEKLKEIDCPLAKVKCNDFPELERQLLERVTYVTAYANEHLEWVEFLLPDKFDEDEGKVEENNDDDDADDDNDDPRARIRKKARDWPWYSSRRRMEIRQKKAEEEVEEEARNQAKIETASSQNDRATDGLTKELTKELENVTI